jgi:hypothetical protein
VSPVKYEQGCYIPEDPFFIVTAVKTSNLTLSDEVLLNPRRPFLKKLFLLFETVEQLGV